jgi:flagella basal body P-ring formation protein FlgA
MKYPPATTAALGLSLFFAPAQAGLELLLQPLDPSSSSPVAKPVQITPAYAPDVQAIPLAQGEVAEVTQAEGNVLTIDKLLPELVAGLIEKHNIEGDFRLTPRERWNPFYVPGGDWKVEVVESIPSRLASISIIQFKIYGGDRLLGVWKQSFKCQLFQDVLFSEDNLSRGLNVSESDFAARNVDVLQLRQRPVLAGELDGRQQLRQYLNPGTPLSWRHVASVPLVRRGEIIDVVAMEGALMISMKGKAIDDGADGDLIRVSNLSTNKKFQAQVIDDKKARVLF